MNWDNYFSIKRWIRTNIKYYNDTFIGSIILPIALETFWTLADHKIAGYFFYKKIYWLRLFLNQAITLFQALGRKINGFEVFRFLMCMKVGIEWINVTIRPLILCISDKKLHNTPNKSLRKVRSVRSGYSPVKQQLCYFIIYILHTAVFHNKCTKSTTYWRKWWK